jgi:hypothetical protein
MELKTESGRSSEIVCENVSGNRDVKCLMETVAERFGGVDFVSHLSLSDLCSHILLEVPLVLADTYASLSSLILALHLMITLRMLTEFSP